jgi:membrane protein DedA with SNARE-associated domain
VISIFAATGNLGGKVGKEKEMDATMIRVVAGVLAAVVLCIIIYRRRRKSVE